ncbi:hypothetical protein [Lachnoclostridium sp. An118]|uniref:hypothetical protein n=1 Tax=Lachnoclostridium sp. An118 TaxID=1965547 RepID=UPI000B3AC67E|nr:hypothetical protein [Lachnoclostridium sp. An118]OUQ46154.1 hypothetical protein B5E62_16270 [Lachnoclostridium sp. An118]
MKRKMVKRMALAAAGMAAISLTACGGTKGVSNAKGEEPIPASEAFGQEGVWFYSDSAAAKDEKVDSVMSFDGKGNVTTYKTDITYSNLQGLSEKEIVELAKEQDQTVFKTDMQDFAESAEKSKEKAEEEKEDLDSRMEEIQQALVDYPEEYETINADREDLQQEIDNYDELLVRIPQAAYQEPDAQPFTLKLETDQTGNNTASETLVYSCRSGLNADVSEADGDSWQPYRETEEEIELYPGLGVQEVYDMRFQGFGTLVLMTGEDHPGFSLDTPDARGVEVD